MDGTVLYELRLHFNPLPILVVWMLFAVFVLIEDIRVAAYIRAGRMAKGREDKSVLSFRASVLLNLLFGVVTAIIFGFIAKTMVEYRAVEDAYGNGQTLTAEGPVEDFTLRQDFFTFYEEFTVDGVRFSSFVKRYGRFLPGYPARFGIFDRNRGGGLIREGQMLRIQYVTLPGRGRSEESEYADYHCIVFVEELP